MTHANRGTIIALNAKPLDLNLQANSYLQRDTVIVTLNANIVDESGNQLVDESGNNIVADYQETWEFYKLNARPLVALLHA